MINRQVQFIATLVGNTVLFIIFQQWLALLAFYLGVVVTVWYVSRLPQRTSRYHRLKRNGGKHTDQQWAMLVRRYNYRCAACQRNDIPLTKDHVVPVSRGGNDNISNLQPLCTACNSRKGTQIIRY